MLSEITQQYKQYTPKKPANPVLFYYRATQLYQFVKIMVNVGQDTNFDVLNNNSMKEREEITQQV